MKNKRRVVVTGLGAVSSIGIGKDAFWYGLTNGKSGISEVTAFDTSAFKYHMGGEVKSFNPEEFIPS
jgi:3-oxoacyl-[acyl-carrier-protein] synthase II